MAIRLTIVEAGAPRTEHVRAFSQARVVIGRARSCDVCLPDMAVSTHHAEIRLQGTDYHVVDLGSLNGTTVDGRQLVAHRPRRLRNGEMIGVAGFGIRFNLGVTGPSERRGESARQAREMLASMLARSGRPDPAPALVVVSGPGRASRFELGRAPCRAVVGRASSCAIRVDDPDVSREHAEVVVEPEGVIVRDLGSRNGVFKDGERVDAVRLEPGGAFTVGGTTFALEHPADAPLAEIWAAPEEQTSSFVVPEAEPPDAARPADPPAAAAARSDPLPTGPADPLVDPAPAVMRTTRQIPAPQAEGGSDLGLIVVGAIVVVATVAALVYLFS